jgi:hypothetical protein
VASGSAPQGHFLEVVSSQSTMTGLTANLGDWCLRSDVPGIFQLNTLPATTATNWGGTTTFTPKASYLGTVDSSSAMAGLTPVAGNWCFRSDLPDVMLYGTSWVAQNALQGYTPRLNGSNLGVVDSSGMASLTPQNGDWCWRSDAPDVYQYYSTWSAIGLLSTLGLSSSLYLGLAASDSDMTAFGSVGGVTITNEAYESGYTSAPTVTFSAPPSGITATGTATLSTYEGNTYVSGVTITNPGSGYVTAPTVTFSGGGLPSGAPAAAGAATSSKVAGNWYWRSDVSAVYRLAATPASTLSNWSNLGTGIPGLTANLFRGTVADDATMNAMTANYNDRCWRSDMGAFYREIGQTLPVWAFEREGATTAYHTTRPLGPSGVVGSQADMLAFTGAPSDWCFRSDAPGVYKLIGLPASSLASWEGPLGIPATGDLTMASNTVAVNAVQTPDQSAYGTVLAGVNFPAGALPGSAVRLLCNYTDESDYAFAEYALAQVTLLREKIQGFRRVR